MKHITTLVFVLITLTTYAQNGNVGIGTTTPDPAAKLQIDATDGGLLIPRMTTSQRIAISSPPVGLLVFDTDTKSFWYNRGPWINMGKVSMLEDADGDTYVHAFNTTGDDDINFQIDGTLRWQMRGYRLHNFAPSGNLMIGRDAGNVNTGSSNTLLGSYTGRKNTTGNGNTFIGNLAGGENTIGFRNTAIGNSAGGKNVDGDQNVFLGTFSGENLASGDNNMFFGYNAGSTITAGNNNLIFGNNYSIPSSTSNKFYINNPIFSDPLVYGEFDNKLFRINGTFNINNAFSFPTVDGTANQVLETDGNGMLTWASSANSIQSKIEADNTTVETYDAGGTHPNNSINFSIDGTRKWTMIGDRLEAPLDNLLIGFISGEDLTTGTRNVFLGSNAGRNTTQGSNNIYIGAAAGANNILGAGNIFIGDGVGSNEMGSNKLFIENSFSTSPLIYGEFDNDLLRVNGTFNINNAFSFPTMDGTANQVLETNGSGTLSWTTPTFSKIQDGDMDTSVESIEGAGATDKIEFKVDNIASWQMVKNRLEPLNNESNTFIGVNSGLNITSSPGIGTGNSFFGENAGKENTNGNYNTFLGHQSGLKSKGNSNVYIGNNSGVLNVTGNFNTLVGINTGSSLTSGNNNVLVGQNSGGNLTSGEDNVFIGPESGSTYSSLSNKLIIENSNSTTPLVYGEFDNDLLRVNGTFNINNAFSFPTVDGTANQVLATDGNGNLFWSVTSGSGSSSKIEDADMDTSVESVEGAGASDKIEFKIDNIVSWQMIKDRLEPLNNDYNTFVGANTGLNTNPSGSLGVRNSFIGENAGKENTSGYNNTVLGHNALMNNESGFENVAIGSFSGDRNKSSYNTYVGYQAGTTNMTGADLLCIGWWADATIDGLQDATAIGENAKVNASNKIRIGNTGITVIEGQVGWSFPSDGRFKNNVNEDVPGLEFINLLRPVSYNFDKRKYNEHVQGKDWLAKLPAEKRAKELENLSRSNEYLQSGFIAQEVEIAAKRTHYEFSGVVKPSNPTDNYSLRYAEFTVPLVKAVQELSEENTQLKEKLAKQDVLLKDLLNRMNALESSRK